MSTNINAKSNGAQSATILNGNGGGALVSNAPLTTDLADKAAPGLLRNAIDVAVTKIRPMATPLDQISRLGHVRPVDSLEVDYYSVDTRPDRTDIVSVDQTRECEESEGFVEADVTLAEPGIAEVSETLCWTDDSGAKRTAYICAKEGGKVTLVMAGDEDDASTIAGKEVIRMGRAATQLDVQSPQFSVLPRKRTNFCQIFKMQIEQSLVMKMSHKEIGWDFTDQQEAAIYDMRLGMEKQFLFGNKMKFYDSRKGENVLLTQGVWSQAGKEHNLDLSALDGDKLVDLLRAVFTENSGSRRKILIAGSSLIAALNKLDAQRVITARDQVTLWGIDFSELCSKFGRLYVIFSDVFDAMGMDKCGIVIDPEYIQKHVFIPFNAESIDLRGSGQRNTEAMVLTEASCLTLRYPEAHTRIIGA